MATTIRIPIDFRNPRVSTLAGNSYFNVLGLTDWDAGVWEFVKDVDGKLYGIVSVPNTIDATPAAKIILVIAANATSGVTRLNIGVKPVADNESINPSSLNDQTSQDITVPATAYLRKNVTFTLPTSGDFPVVGNDILLLEIFHEGAHANDTLAVNTLLLEAYLEIDV